VPPLDCREAEYAEPIVPEGRDDEVIVKAVGAAGGAVTTGRETVVVADCTDEPESVTLMPNE
jgi:5S rRNA maturation endonuclease (ribonuclease M5)